MKRKTHRRVTKALLPKLPTKKIDRINSRLDKPEPTTPDSPEFAKLPGLDYRGHRKKSHDPLMAGLTGFQEAGLDGVAAAEIHIALDVASDVIRIKTGAETRDLIEAIGNLAYKLWKEKKRNGN